MYTKTVPELAEVLLKRIEIEKTVINIDGMDIEDVQGFLRTFANKKNYYTDRMTYRQLLTSMLLSQDNNLKDTSL